MFRSHGEDVMRRAMAVVNVVNQTSTLVPAVLGGVLYAAVLGRDSITPSLWTAETSKPCVDMQTAAINHGDVGRSRPIKYTFAPYLAYIRQIRETWIHSWVIRPERTSGSRSHFLTKPTTCSTLFPNRHLPDPIARLRRIRHDAPSQTLPSDALYWPCAR